MESFAKTVDVSAPDLNLTSLYISQIRQTTGLMENACEELKRTPSKPEKQIADLEKELRKQGL